MLDKVPGIENAEYEIAEVRHDTESLTRLFKGAKVVCNMVGPFMKYGPEAVEARGGEMLAPGSADNPIQFIDVRDLVAFMVRVLENRASGVYNVAGPRSRMTMREFLEGARDALKAAPGIEIVETYDIKEDAVRCAEIIATGSRRYPDLGAWLSVGGWPVFTRNALAGVDSSKTKVISVDTPHGRHWYELSVSKMPMGEGEATSSPTRLRSSITGTAAPRPAARRA